MKIMKFITVFAFTVLVVFCQCSVLYLEGQTNEGKDFRKEPMRVSRAKWQPPDKIMDAIGLKNGMVVGEVGSGACGGFTYYLAERVGANGRVLANDISKKALSALIKNLKNYNFENVESILGLEDDPQFPPGKLDMAIMVDMFDFFKYPVKLLNNLIPSLKPGAPLVIVDLKPRTQAILEAVNKSDFELKRMETWLQRENIMILYPRSNQ